MECFYPPITPRHRYPALRGNIMATTATTTSRVAYKATLLSRIAEKRAQAHQLFLENATKDLRQVYIAEKSRVGIGFHTKYVWSF